MSAQVKIYYTPYCFYCTRALALLERKGVAHEKIDVSSDRAKRAWLVEVTGRSTVPQIFINGTSIGGCDELHELDDRGELDRMLRQL